MRARELSSVLVLAALWYASGCYSTSVVGTSDGSPDEQPRPRGAGPVVQPAANATPKTATTIAARPGEHVGLYNPFLGDVDGDGFDDFLVSALVATPEDIVRIGEEARAYLYYGRPDFPAQLSTADADAVFLTSELGSGPLGDIDGDGLQDFVLARVGSAEIVLGSAKRLRGTYMPFAAGSRWHEATLPSPFDPGASQMNMRGLGDLDSDGIDDLAIDGAELLSDEDALRISAAFGLSIQSYLVPGHAGSWLPTTWDKSQAVAKFGYELVEADPVDNIEAFAAALAPIAIGDLDGDGHDDAGAVGAHGLYVFYGGREYRGVIEPEDADAYVLLAAQIVAVGDADGDGASDLIVVSPDGKIGVHYGRRWSGKLESEPDLELRIAGIDPSSLSAAAGDIDGDGLPELVLASPPNTISFDNPIPSPLDGSVFVLRGTGKRATGERVLGERDLLVLGPKPGKPLKIEGDNGFGLRLSMNGDVDGDGGNDILTSSMLISAGEMATSSVHLIPSTPRTPD